MAALGSVAARVCVADTEMDVLFLIAQYLRDLGLSTTVVALLRESGLDPTWLCGPSREIASLREWIFLGEWARVRALLDPLRDALGEHGIAAARARVDKQELLEEFYFTNTPARRRREIIEQLQVHSAHDASRLDKHELQCCVQLLTDENSLAPVWSLDEARLNCFEALVPLFRGPIEDADEESKYLQMPRRQLVSLLSDALLFQKHHNRRSLHDIISLTPISTERYDRGSEDAITSLRLVERTNASTHRRFGGTLSQSVDLSRFVGNQVPSSASSKNRLRNPLVMSMAFSSARRAQSERPNAVPLNALQDETLFVRPVNEHDYSPTIKTHSERREVQWQVEDAETQTDTILSTDQATETSTELAFVSTLSPARSESVRKDSVDHVALDASNQTADTAADQDLISERSKATLSSSTTELVISNAPLEAWCTSRRGEVPEELQSPQRITTPQQHQSASDEEDDAWGEQQIDHEPRTWKDEDDDPADHGQSDTALAPLRSYSQLTIDSVVRAHVVAEVREAQAVRAMDIAPDGGEMVIGTNARALRIFDLNEPLANSSLANSDGLSFLPLLPVSLERHKHHSSSIYTACYNHISPAHAAPLIATGAAESSIKVLARWTQQEVWIRGHTGKSRALCFASRSLLCSAASGDMLIRVWDVEGSSGSGNSPCVQRYDGHVGEILAMAIASSPMNEPSETIDRRCFVSSSMDRTVRLWDIRTGQCARVLARLASPAYAVAFQSAFHNGTNVISTGHQDGSVSLWDLRTTSSKATKPLATMSHHHDECRAVSWSPDGQWLLSAAFDGTLCLLEAGGSQAMSAVASFHQHQDKILQAQWHPTQPAIVTTGADKLIKLWGFT